MPLHVIGEQAQEDLRPHPVGQKMVDRANIATLKKLVITVGFVDKGASNYSNFRLVNRKQSP